MLKRIATSVIGLAVFFTVVFTHHYVLYAAVLLLTGVMLYEAYKAIDASIGTKITGFISAFVLFFFYFFGKFIFAVYAFVMINLIAMVFLHGKKSSKEVLYSAFVTLFITAFMFTLILIRRNCDRYTVILPFVCAWLTDTGAYFAGTLLGRHKLAEHISPKKTIEGAIGGLILSTIGAILYIIILVRILAGGMANTEALIKFAFIGFVGSVIAQLGDLVASVIKRDFDKKDYGTILPGHGGFLDRFDSVIFVAPFIYYAFLHIIL